MINKIGKQGENIASTYLINKGYDIVKQNYRNNRCEIDIIAKKNGFVIAIEVKTRTQNPIMKPWKAVNKLKQKKIIKVMDSFINKSELDLEVRFDIISIIKKGNKHQIEHLINAFYAT